MNAERRGGVASNHVVRRAAIIALAVMAFATSACSDDHRVSATPKSPKAAPTAASSADKDRQPSSGAAQSAKSSIKKPAPLETSQLPFKPDRSLHIAASISPTCVRIGDSITLRVQTEPKATVAFQAIYSNGKSGAQGFGGNYGGNAAEKADDSGNFSNTWKLANNPPTGWARADIYVFSGTTGRGRGNYASVDFYVAELTGPCPS